MNIPKKLKIGGHTYKVITEKPGEINERGTCGVTNKSKGIISINKNLIQSEKECTLIHEIFHIINNELNEAVIESLSQQLYQVLRENKLLKNGK